MKLSGREIAKAVASSDIVISDFDESRVQPNSYDVTLFPELVIYNATSNSHGVLNGAGQIIPQGPLDPKRDNLTTSYEIPEEGFVIVPGELYLARTAERAGSIKYIPGLDGRSSVARLGVAIHVTAGFGDVGFVGAWTLEITCVRPVVLYPYMPIGQVYFEPVLGEVDTYNGKYNDQIENIIPSRLHKHWEKNNG